ncbi:MAG: demethylmenaquinone methyltransferase [Actinomycetota bacterium]|nr:demethylmenaquinone methyltransferase [Actinomycetota bacterium]MDA3026747.1 demethylmenaquinone methyltransferase [Actinomycetota bacterium]
MSKASLTKNPREVAAMFDRVAAKYDITNDVLAFGLTHFWRKATANAVAAKKGEKILDLAAGTGTSSLAFAKSGATVIPCDFSLGMLQEGNKRSPQLNFSAGDALSLPFADETFDAVTISFGVRNVNNVDKALKEMLRVTKPGGRIVICEFSSPTFEPFRKIYMEYLMKALPAIAKKTSSNPDAYVYLADSIRAWPNQKDFALQINNSNWNNVKWKNLTGGIVCLHKAEKSL